MRVLGKTIRLLVTVALIAAGITVGWHAMWIDPLVFFMLLIATAFIYLGITIWERQPDRGWPNNWSKQGDEDL